MQVSNVLPLLPKSHNNGDSPMRQQNRTSFKLNANAIKSIIPSSPNFSANGRQTIEESNSPPQKFKIHMKKMGNDLAASGYLSVIKRMNEQFENFKKVK